MKIYDTHSHTNIDPLINQYEFICEQCIKNNIYFNIVGTNYNDSLIAIDQAKKCKNAKAIIGIHPSEKSDFSLIGKIEKLIFGNKNVICAIGETGLDYHYENIDFEKQKKSFINHIELSKKTLLPLVIHVRDAHDDCIEIIKRYKAANQKIVIHCFTGDLYNLKAYLEMNCYISISGIVTFKNSNSLRDLIKHIPLNRLLIETDSPWLAPEPNRGKVNSPLNVKFVLEKIALTLNMDIEELSKQIFKNSLDFFNYFE